MNVIFLTLLDFRSFDERNIYCDLLRAFAEDGHTVYAISPAERRMGIRTHFEENGRLLKLRIGNTQKSNFIEKGISTLCIEPQFVSAIKRRFADVKFDLVLYSTPPVTLANAVSYLKKRDGAATYLLLKDIFPQNAVDIGILPHGGLLYRYFRGKEKRLYALSDRIGCMSEANVAYLLKQDPEIPAEKVEICPNCIEPVDRRVSSAEKTELRRKYGLPLDKRLFVYGGNLGRPQDVPFIVECLKACADVEEAHFVIAGSGTDSRFIEEYVAAEKPRHVTFLGQLPKEEYDGMIACCDVGLLFLDHRFTIPNYPSRLLSYMQAGLPVLACTDVHTDVGKAITEGGFGLRCESSGTAPFAETVKKTLRLDLEAMGETAFAYLNENFAAKRVYKTVFKHTVKE